MKVSLRRLAATCNLAIDRVPARAERLVTGFWPLVLPDYGWWLMHTDTREPISPLLRILDDLANLIECTAMGELDEVRYQLHLLCDRVDTDPRLRCDDSDIIAARLRHALEKYNGYDRKPSHGQSLLISLSRDLWKRVHPSPPQAAVTRASPAHPFRPIV